jgi:hypothetical protein
LTVPRLRSVSTIKTLSRKDFGPTDAPPSDRQANCAAALHFTKGNPFVLKGTCVKCASRTARFEITLDDAGAAIVAAYSRAVERDRLR